MRLKYTFESVNMGDEIICVPVGEDSEQVKGILRLNAEGLEILQMLKNEISEEDIVNELQKKYENDQTSLKNYVSGFISKLINAGVIEE